MKNLKTYLIKTLSLIAIIAATLFSSCGDDESPGERWTRKASFPGYIYDSSPTFTIGDKAYMMRSRELWEYNQKTNEWTRRASIPYAQSGDKDEAFGFSLNGKGYVGCGGDLVSSKDFWQYDPSNDTWTKLPDFPGIARYSAQCFVLNGKAYVLSGENISISPYMLKDMWEYDASSGQWTRKNDITFPARVSAVGFAIGNKGYVGTGYNPYLNPILNDFYEYEASTDTWTQKTNFPADEGRYTAVGFGIGNRGFVATGFKNVGEGFNDVYEYIPSKNAWVKRANVGLEGRFSAVSFVINNTAYIGGGEPGDYELVKEADGIERVHEYVWACTFNLK